MLKEFCPTSSLPLLGTLLKHFSHDQVKLLLERMDTHPEEFINSSKWEDFLPVPTHARPVISPRFKHFTKLEQYLIRQKYNRLVMATLRQRAYDGILETLVFKEDKQAFLDSYTANQPVLGTPPSYTVSISETLHQAAKKVHRTSS